MEKKKCKSYFGDYKCHVKTNVKDSKGNFVYVDKCLKEAVENLNAVGLKTVASCCGHGIINPKITIEGLSEGKPEYLKSGNCNLADVMAMLPTSDEIEEAKNKYHKDGLSRIDWLHGVVWVTEMIEKKYNLIKNEGN